MDWLLAEATAIEDFKFWTQMATNGGFGALVFYLIVKFIPSLHKRFDEHSDKQQQQFAVQLKDQRDQFINEIKAQRDDHKQEIERLMEAHERQIALVAGKSIN